MIIRIPKTTYYHKWFIGATLVVPVLPLTAQTSPNLVFIMADQYRGDALGCLGKEPVKTPCLDHLASEGVLFTNAVSSYPVSSPARAMLMTGMYPLHNKVTGNCNSQTAPYGVELPQEARCWSDVLKDMNYRTGYIGKWHLDSPYKPYVDTYNNRGKVAWNEWCPPERRHGFEYWTAYGTYDYHLKPMYWDTTAPRDSFYGKRYVGTDVSYRQIGTSRVFSYLRHHVSYGRCGSGILDTFHLLQTGACGPPRYAEDFLCFPLCSGFQSGDIYLRAFDDFAY